MKRLGPILWLVTLALTATLFAGAGEPDNDAEPPITRLKIREDRAAEVVLGPNDSARVIVYLHGVCGDPLAFRSWASVAAKRATFISMRGDLKCEKRKGRYKWSYNLKGLDRRIDRAIAAVETLREERADGASVTPLDTEHVVLMGYSQGAHRVESMAHRFPERYARVAIIAPAREPEVAHLDRSERILLIAGEKDAKKHIRDAHDKLTRAGHEALYLELPGARHGEYGAQAKQVMARGLDWLYK